MHSIKHATDKQMSTFARLLREESKVLFLMWAYNAQQSSYSNTQREDMQRIANRARHSH